MNKKALIDKRIMPHSITDLCLPTAAMTGRGKWKEKNNEIS
jgi:hypothetical protein